MEKITTRNFGETFQSLTEYYKYNKPPAALTPSARDKLKISYLS